MWHITNKLPSKVSGHILNNTNLHASIHKLVWNVYLDPSAFEARWKLLMEKHGLQDHKWLSDMFDIRDQWVPGYFKDIPMCCLMKTTSRCESSNSYFKLNSSPSNTLVQFLLCYDNAIDGQRYNQRVLEFNTTTTVPIFLTSLLIERHASEIYTRNIFLEVQKEIHKCKTLCYVVSREEDDGVYFYKIAHQDNNSDVINEFKVTLDLTEKIVTCSCISYTRIGYLCRHAFCVFRHHKIEKVPDQYVHGRWRRDAIPRRVFSMEYRYYADQSENSVLRHRLMDTMQQCVDRLRLNSERLTWLDDHLQQLKNQIFNEFPQDPSYNKNGIVIEEVLHQFEPVEVTYKPPAGIRNKGCGKNRRLIGPGEKAKVKSKKPKKMCNYCSKYVRGHDSRNCLDKLKLLNKDSKKVVHDDESSDYSSEDNSFEDESNDEEDQKLYLQDDIV